MLKVLFAALKYDYGRPGQGLSMEHANLYDCLSHMSDVQADFFGIDEEMMASGRDSMNQKLISRVEETKPDLLFCFLFREEIKKETIAYITKNTKTKTFNWFADDHWRLPIFSRYWAPLFTMVSTTDAQAPKIYKSYGITNVLKTQWGANPYSYFPHDESKNPGNLSVTFLGKNYPARSHCLDRLKQADVDVQAFGSGWPASPGQGGPGGRLNHQRVLELFSYSKINLNFSGGDFSGFKAKARLFARLFFARESGGYKFIGGHFFDNLRSAKGVQKKSIKGQVFEIPSCGGFLMTQRTDDPIGEYYTPDKEMAVFDGPEDLAEKAKYYLAHEAERRAIAKAGYERTVKEHTYAHRFMEIFRAMGLI